MIKCNQCHERQPETEYYHRPNGMPYAICKNCKKANVTANRLRNVTHYREYDNRRDVGPERKARHSRYVPLAEKDPEDCRMCRCRSTTRAAVRNGTLVKPKICQLCARKRVTEAHHRNYDRPLQIVWLCKLCHEGVHHLTVIN